MPLTPLFSSLRCGLPPYSTKEWGFSAALRQAPSLACGTPPMLGAPLEESRKALFETEESLHDTIKQEEIAINQLAIRHLIGNDFMLEINLQIL